MPKCRVILLFVASLLVPVSLTGQDNVRKNSELTDQRPQQARRGGGEMTPGNPGLTKGPIDRMRSRDRSGKQVSSNLAPATRTNVQLDEIVEQLHSMEIHGGGDPLEDDWFVVGGSVGSDVNFDAFQGERDVAQRVVDFVESTNDEGQWRVFYRVQDPEKAEELVSKVQSDYGKWHRKQQRAAAAAQRRVQAAQRSAAAAQRSRRSGGFRTSGVGRSGNC